MVKICSKCGIQKSIEDFYGNTKTSDNLASWCKMCVRTHMRAYRQTHKKNKEQCAAYARAYYLANKDKFIGTETAKKRAVERRYGPAPYNTYAPQIGFADNICKSKDGQILTSCVYCGKMFMPTITAIGCRIQALNSVAKGECRLYCSDACKDACPSYHRRKHWKSQKVATSREVSAYFRQLVLERDGWTCQKCGAGTDAQLHVHHIEGATQQPGMANDLENGITLCRECHKHVHSQDGCKYHELKCPVKVV